MNDIVFGTWISRILRWALAFLFAWLAYTYKEARILYIFAGLLFITGFFTPKKCIDGCEITPAAEPETK